MDFLLIDAFAARPFAGNPAAVVRLPPDSPTPPDAFLQNLAMEFNQAETAYVAPLPDGRFDLRWFTPAREVELCGHATLAAAHALWQWGDAPLNQPIRFATRWSGQLVCTRAPDGRIAMDFPATPPKPQPLPDTAQNVATALNVAGPVTCVGSAGMNLTLQLADEAQVRACNPDLAQLSKWHPIGVTVTARSSQPGVDFVSRFFAPNAGVPEDPVTGSAHCSLAVHWSRVLGKTTFEARQLSKRGGELNVRLSPDGTRVELSGNAVTTVRGTVEAKAG